MTFSSKQIALIKVAVGKLGMGDDTYRSAPAQIGGVTTSKDLDKTGFEAQLGFFEYCGFTPLEAKGPTGRKFFDLTDMREHGPQRSKSR